MKRTAPLWQVIDRGNEVEVRYAGVFQDEVASIDEALDVIRTARTPTRRYRGDVEVVLADGSRYQERV